MNETMQQIQKMANERQYLWRLAGQREISPEQRQRIGEITTRLDILWDQYRREYAASKNSQAASARRNAA